MVGSQSTDNTGISAYEWVFSDDSAARAGQIIARAFDVPGSYTVTLVVADGYGNKSTPETAEILVKEKGHTVITISGVENGGRYNIDRTVDITVTDGDLSRVTMDGLMIEGRSFVIDNDTPTPHVLCIEATNTYDYVTKEILTFSMDKTRPVAACAANRTGYYSEETTFDGSASTDLNGIAEYKWISSDETEPRYGKVVTRTFPRIGGFSGTLAVKDTFGNWSEPFSFTVTVIYRPVEIVFTGVQNGGHYNHDVTVHITAEYGTVVGITDQDGTAFGNDSTLTESKVYQLTAVGVNLGGEERTVQTSFTLDKQAPVAGILASGPIKGYNDGKPLTLDGSPSTDNLGLAAYEWVISDDPSHKHYGMVLQHAFPVAGTYTATLTVVDTCGNRSAPVSVVLEVRDKGSTEIVITGIADDGKYNADVSIVISVVNGTLTRTTLDNVAFGTTGINVGSEQPNPHILEVEAINENEYVTTRTVRFRVDKTAPVAMPGVEWN